MGSNNKSIEVDGIIYGSIRDCCAVLDLSIKLVYDLMYKLDFDNVKDAIDICLTLRSSGKVIYKSLSYSNLFDACLNLGIPVFRLWNFKCKNNIDNMQDLFIAYIDSFETYCVYYDGLFFNSRKDCCKYFDLTYRHVVYTMDKYGIDFYNAIDGLVNGIYPRDCGRLKHTGSFEYEGVIYSSRLDCCKKLGVSENGVRNIRKRNDCTFEEALQIALDKKKEFRYNNVIYSSKNDCCRKLKVDRQSIINISNKADCSFDVALDKYFSVEHPHYSTVQLDINEKHYDTLESCCEDLGLCITTVYRTKKRLKFDSLQSTIEYMLSNRPVKFKSFEYHGVVYDSITSCAKELGIPLNTVRNRDTSVDIVEWIDSYIKRKKARKFEYDGIVYDSVKDCCNAMGITYVAFCSFKSRYKISSNLDAMKAYIDSNVKFVFRNVEFRSIVDACRYYNLDYLSIYGYRKYGFDIDESLSYGIICSKFRIMHKDRVNKFFSDLFNCRCNNCGKEFLFTTDLAFKHIEECTGVD